MALSLAPLPILAFRDNNGNPANGYKLFTYQAGGAIKQATYTDSGGLTPNSNPIILNARGECSVWLTQNITYKFVLAPPTDTDPPTNPIWSADNINQGISNITSDVAPSVDATYSLGTTVLRWLNVIISGAFKIVNSSFAMAFQLGQNLSANRTVTIPDSTLLLGGSIVYFQRTNYVFTTREAGATLVNDAATTLTYTLNNGIFLPGTEIQIEQIAANGTITVTAGAGVTLYDYKSGTTVASFPVLMGERIKIKHLGGDNWSIDYHVQSGSFVATLTGFTAATTGTVFYSISGDMVTLYSAAITGTSNSTTMTMAGLPTIILPFSSKEVTCSSLEDNSVTGLGGSVLCQSGGFTFNLARTDTVANKLNYLSTGFTAANVKGITNGWSISYSRK